ncbi:hypothetical protein [Clostridium sp.]|uniref:hypothetical protein n=1 Tax=Clostridium sp. TaxID=1506 RepID=UPI001A3B3EB3|nr:hypothetical protein [Clostridium sp.]MBK5243093.1 hypothetical protein [Clostridium sp.]
MTIYAKLLNKATIKLGDGEEARAEKLIIKATGEEELRFSWWTQDGKQFQRAPLDLKEDDWLKLFDAAVKEKVVSEEFVSELIKVLENRGFRK